MKVLFFFNQFVKFVFCIEQFCILWQTENGYLISFCGNENRVMGEKKIMNAGVQASTGKSRVRFRLFDSSSTKPRRRQNNLKT